MDDLIRRTEAIEAVERIGSLDTDADREYARSIISALPSADAETVLCALADRTCPFQGKEFVWCLTCPHISEEDRELVKRTVSEQKTSEWIPCSDRLPKKGEVVLITNGKGNVRCGQYRSEYDVRDGTHYWWWKGKTVESVLAWMPLPKPYREEGEV